MSIVIKIENLSKRYYLNHKGQERFPTLRDAIMRTGLNMGKRLLHPLQASSGQPLDGLDSTEEFWALKDVSFEVKQGERVGIIGRNGAGKSTLLKILSRITEPTKGRVSIKGRVASLLEVGTGFHPELTGRENIYLNGAILGMSKADIKRRFDEIVAFAEVEKFLDTPVKRYSSGMRVRLAFAVAAHLESEILIVDEVLAVGDAQFQKKCLGKMEEVSSNGSTVLFVSHNMGTISSLCQTCILLDSGTISTVGKSSDVVLSYYSKGQGSPASFDYTKTNKEIGDNYAVLLSGAIVDKNEKICSEVDIRESFSIVMRYKIFFAAKYPCFPNFHFYYSDGTYAFCTTQIDIDCLSPGVYEAICHVPGNYLNDGTYFVGLALTSVEPSVRVHFYDPNTLSFNVKDPLENVPTRRECYSGPIPGVVRPLLGWSLRSLE